MSLLKKENRFMCCLLILLTQGIFYFPLAYLMQLLDKDAWYCNYKYWMWGTILFVAPAFVMAFIFLIQITCKVAASLQVPGEELYNSPYVWILCMITPIVGWSLLIVMLLYIEIWPMVMIWQGNLDKFAK